MIDLKEVADATLARARAAFGPLVPDDLKITYELKDLPGGRMGTCSRVRRGREYRVDLNPYLMFRGGPDECRELVIHEVCHALDDVIVGGWGHANGWKMLMKLMGIEDVRPCHTVSTAGLRSKKAKFVAICQVCGTDNIVSMTQHGRLQRGRQIKKKCRHCECSVFRVLADG